MNERSAFAESGFAGDPSLRLRMTGRGKRGDMQSWKDFVPHSPAFQRRGLVAQS